MDSEAVRGPSQLQMMIVREKVMPSQSMFCNEQTFSMPRAHIVVTTPTQHCMFVLRHRALWRGGMLGCLGSSPRHLSKGRMN